MPGKETLTPVPAPTTDATVVNDPTPHHEEIPKEKIDPVTETHTDPNDDGDGEGG